MVGVVTSGSEHLSRAGGGDRGGWAAAAAWAREPRPTATNMAPEKVGLRRPALARRLSASQAASPGPPAPPGPTGRGGEGYSPCRERSSKGARGEPRQVIPGPRGARPPPARLLVAAAEERAGLSELSGQPGPPRPAARPQTARRGWDGGTRKRGKCGTRAVRLRGG